MTEGRRADPRKRKGQDLKERSSNWGKRDVNGYDVSKKTAAALTRQDSKSVGEKDKKKSTRSGTMEAEIPAKERGTEHRQSKEE